MLRRLGKARPRLDPRTLRLERYMDPGRLPTPPQSTSLRKLRSARWPMHCNDSVGCCTVSAVAHSIETWTRAARGSLSPIPDRAVLQAYSEVSGYDPLRPSTDRGAVMLDVMNYWRKAGLGGHRLEVYTSIPNRRPDLLRCAIWLFGGVQLGIQLPQTAEDQLDAGKPWTVPPGWFAWFHPKNRAGSWGGHAVYAVDYDRDWVYLTTWGMVQPASWDWIEAYTDERYACLDEQDWVGPDGLSPSGFDLARLRDDLGRIVAA